MIPTIKNNCTYTMVSTISKIISTTIIIYAALPPMQVETSLIRTKSYCTISTACGTTVQQICGILGMHMIIMPTHAIIIMGDSLVFIAIWQSIHWQILAVFPLILEVKVYSLADTGSVSFDLRGQNAATNKSVVFYSCSRNAHDMPHMQLLLWEIPRCLFASSLLMLLKL